MRHIRASFCRISVVFSAVTSTLLMLSLPSPAFADGGCDYGGPNIFFMGGIGLNGSCLATVQRFVLGGSGGWTVVSPMPTARARLDLARAGPQGLIYAIGGDCGTALKAVEAYDENMDKWKVVAPLPEPRTRLATVAAPDGKIYAIGGKDDCSIIKDTVFIYDPAQNKWGSGPKLPKPRSDLRAEVGPDGKIYAAGGKGPGEYGEKDRCEVFALVPGSASWTPAPPLKTCRSAFGFALGSNKRLVAAGGFSNGTTLSSVESIDPRTDSVWVFEPDSLPVPTASMGFTVDQSGNFRIAGGRSSPGGPPFTGSQSAELIPLPTPHKLTFHLHGPGTPGDYGGFRMDEQQPFLTEPLSLGLLSEQSWFSFPSVNGTFGAGAQFKVTIPCTVGLGLLSTVKLTSRDLGGANPVLLGQTNILAGACLGVPSITVNIPLHVSTPFTLNHRELELTLGSVFGLNLNLGAGQSIVLEATNFVGTPGPTKGIAITSGPSLSL